MRLPIKQRGFSNILLLSGLIIVVGIGLVWYLTSSSGKIISQVMQSPTPTPSPWKTYLNDQYGFTITYPTKGVVVKSDGWSEGECGQAIKLDPKDPTNILVDNFFTIKVIDFKGSIEDYLVSQGAAKIYETEKLASSSAEQALSIGDLKKGVEYARGFPPLVYTKAIYKKGDKLFVMKATQFPNNFGGCVAPSMADPVKYPEIAKIKWDLAQSLRFKW